MKYHFATGIGGSHAREWDEDQDGAERSPSTDGYSTGQDEVPLHVFGTITQYEIEGELEAQRRARIQKRRKNRRSHHH